MEILSMCVMARMKNLFQSPPLSHTPVDISNHFISDLRQVFHSTLVNSSSISPNFYSTPTELSADYRVGLTDALTPKDPRRFDPHFFSAKEKEIERLKSRGKWRILGAEDLRDNSNVMGGRSALTIKYKDRSEELFKAIFVVQGHKYSPNISLFHKAATLHVEI
jgi:hypothetical protein